MQPKPTGTRKSTSGPESSDVSPQSSQRLLQSKHTSRAGRGAGEPGSSLVFASETPCVHYSKQAPARGPSRRIANRWGLGCSVALGRARAWEVLSQPVSGQRSCASRSTGLARALILREHEWASCVRSVRGEGNVSFHHICPCLQSLRPLAAWERGGLCQPQRPPASGAGSIRLTSPL